MILKDFQSILTSADNNSKKKEKKLLTLYSNLYILSIVAHGNNLGSLAQLGEHLPYKQRVIGSSPIVPTISVKTQIGPVVQLVRMPACHAGGRRFEPVPGRQFAQIAQSVEQGTENPRVAGSIPALGTIRFLKSMEVIR